MRRKIYIIMFFTIVALSFPVAMLRAFTSGNKREDVITPAQLF